LIITISDTCKNQPKRLDFDNTINLSSLIVSLDYESIKHPFPLFFFSKTKRKQTQQNGCQ
jgi:hypothetical protein